MEFPKTGQGLVQPATQEDIDKDIAGITAPNLHRRSNAYAGDEDTILVNSEGVKHAIINRKGVTLPVDPQSLSITIRPDEWLPEIYNISRNVAFRYKYVYNIDYMTCDDIISATATPSVSNRWSIESAQGCLIIRVMSLPANDITFDITYQFVNEEMKHDRRYLLGIYGVNSYKQQLIKYHDDNSDESEIP